MGKGKEDDNPMTTDSTRGYQDWTAEQMADYLKTKDLGDYAELFQENNIKGSVAPRINESQLKEMGVSVVGDRIRIIEALETLKKSEKMAHNEKIIWEGEEVLYYSCIQRACATCCGCCPDDPSTYTLRSAHLEIKTVHPCRCGPIRCCCGGSYEIDNIDLSNIQDADVEGVPPSCCHQLCCCAGTLENVKVQTSNEGEKVLVLEQEEGQKAARLIKQQVEAMQRMERS